MIIKKLAIRIVSCEIIVFMLIVVVFWLDELIDIPHNLLGAPATPVNTVEVILETCILSGFGILVILITYFLLRKLLISERKRDELERIFFHDILGIAWDVSIITKRLAEGRIMPDEKVKKSLYTSAALLTKEIEGQRDLIAAENNKLVVNLSSLQSRSILLSMVNIHETHEACHGKHVVVSDDCEEIKFVSDKSLLVRVIGNLLRNALEASKAGQTVILGCYSGNGNISFWCHNTGFIPMEAQKMLFRKAYSTKGKRRGLGTYSVKLLTEKYLKGNVNFVSSHEKGTTFTVSFPFKIEI